MTPTTQISHGPYNNASFHTPHFPSARKRIRSRALPQCCAATPKKVLILGGNGRVGSEAAKALSQVPNIKITLGARRKPRNPDAKFSFTRVDISEASTLLPAIRAHDIVVHTAGPFQHSAAPCAVLEGCLDNGVSYIDISDDTEHSMATKSLHERCVSAGTPALISTGIYPGLSNLLATQAVSRLRSLVASVDSLELYYHTAGSGGIGVTVLAATMLLLSERATEYTPSGALYHPAASGVTKIDFGADIGTVATYRLNLPEVYSLHKYVTPEASVSARFSTAPPVWNALLQGMARLPHGVLSSKGGMQMLARFSMPVVRAVDRVSGARTGIVVKARGGGREVVVRFACERLDRCVGECIAGFVKAVVRGSVQSGVWFPEELGEGVRGEVVREVVADGTVETFVDGVAV